MDKLSNKLIMNYLNETYLGKEIDFEGNDEVSPFTGTVCDIRFDTDFSILIALRDQEDDVFEFHLSEIQNSLVIEEKYSVYVLVDNENTQAIHNLSYAEAEAEFINQCSKNYKKDGLFEFAIDEIPSKRIEHFNLDDYKRYYKSEAYYINHDRTHVQIQRM